MKKMILSAIVAGLLVSHSQAALMITEVMSSSAHSGGTNNGDWFELTNTGASAFSLTGFSWDDNTNTPGSSGFGSLTSIASGQSVIISEETVGAESSWAANWGNPGLTVVNLGSGGFQGLGAGGDAVNIYDGSNALVTSVTFGTATAGSSFEWDTLGNSLGVSVAGENGAYVAPQNGQTTGAGPGLDIGSPGIAVVPEPSTYLLLGLGLFFSVFARRSVIFKRAA